MFDRVAVQHQLPQRRQLLQALQAAELVARQVQAAQACRRRKTVLIRQFRCPTGTGCKQHVDIQFQCSHRCPVQTVGECVIVKDLWPGRCRLHRPTGSTPPTCAQTLGSLKPFDRIPFAGWVHPCVVTRYKHGLHAAPPACSACRLKLLL